MAKFKVLVENFAAPLGEVIDDADIAGANVEALVAAGVLKPEISKNKTDKE